MRFQRAAFLVHVRDLVVAGARGVLRGVRAHLLHHVGGYGSHLCVVGEVDLGGVAQRLFELGLRHALGALGTVVVTGLGLSSHLGKELHHLRLEVAAVVDVVRRLVFVSRRLLFRLFGLGPQARHDLFEGGFVEPGVGEVEDLPVVQWHEFIGHLGERVVHAKRGFGGVFGGGLMVAHAAEETGELARLVRVAGGDVGLRGLSEAEPDERLHERLLGGQTSRWGRARRERRPALARNWARARGTGRVYGGLCVRSPWWRRGRPPWRAPGRGRRTRRLR